MGQNICYMVNYGNDSYPDCYYQSYASQVAYVFYYDNVQMGICIAEVILLLIFWMCTCRMKHDFTRAFFTAVMLAVSADTVIRTIVMAVQVFDLTYNMDSSMYSIYQSINNSSTYLDNWAVFAFLYCSAYYGMVSLTTACNKKNYGTHCPLFLILTAATSAIKPLLDMVPYNVGLDTQTIKMILTGFPAGYCAAVIVLGILSNFCHASEPFDKSGHYDPVVINARSRLNWSYFILLGSVVIGGIMIYGTMWYDSSMITIALYCWRVILLALVFLTIPAYRSAFFCCETHEIELPTEAPEFFEMPSESSAAAPCHHCGHGKHSNTSAPAPAHAPSPSSDACHGCSSESSHKSHHPHGRHTGHNGCSCVLPHPSSHHHTQSSMAMAAPSSSSVVIQLPMAHQPMMYQTNGHYMH